MPAYAGRCVPFGRKRAIPAGGMANAAFSRMKPVLLLAFLALGPALAEQFPILPRAASEAVAQRSGTTLPTAPGGVEPIWLCRR
jgi:hypothetical protein